MGFTPPLFGKIGSKVKDLLNKKFDYHNEIKVSSKADGGLSLEAAGTDAGKGGLAGFTTIKYKNSSFGEAEGTLHTSGAAKDTKASVKFDKFQTGADVKFSSGANLVPVFEGNYKQDSLTFNTKFTTGDKSSLTAAATYGYTGITVGGAVATTDFGSLSDYNAGAEYSNSDLTLSLLTTKKASNYHVSFLHNWAKDLSWGARFDIKDTNLLTVGTEYSLDSATTLKAVGSTTGAVAVAVEHKVQNPDFKMNLAAAFNTNSGLVAEKFGVGLNFGQ